MDILLSFPHFIPQNAERTHYKGFINIKEHSFYLDIRLKSPTNLEEVSVLCDWKLRDLLKEYQQLLSERLQQTKKLVDFLHELKRIANGISAVTLKQTTFSWIEKAQNSTMELQLEARHHRNSTSSILTTQIKLYDRLIDEIEEIGWERVVYIDQTFKELHLVTEDRSCRKHILKINLQNEHPRQAPWCCVDLPKAFEFVWTAESKLGDLFDQFCHNLDQYQDLWDNFDEIDKNTWILEPEKPSRGALYRRLALGSNYSVQITVNVDHPRMLPDCKFLGPEHVISPLKAKLNTNLHKWDVGLTLLTNLQTVLEIKLPSPSETKKQDYSVECGICYTYRLGNEIPDEACDDPRCGQPFHHSCLFEWLRSLPSFRQSFNVTFGECPYCSTPISVKTRW